MNDSIPDLNIKLIQDGIGDGLIMLEQDGGGNVDRVAIHPLHIRYMAEKLGLVATSDPQAYKTIAMLTRRLLALTDRINHLANWMAQYSDHQHADLSYELEYATATSDIANEFCADLVDQHSGQVTESVTVTKSAPPTKTQAEPNASQAPLFTESHQ